jgi:hypothetical protein
MDIDLDELERKAESVPPGPWRIDPDAKIDCSYGRESGGIVGPNGEPIVISDPSEGEYNSALDLDSAIAAYIAAANPAVILELIRRVREK